MHPDRTLWTAGCILALLAVAAGAFGAHALRNAVPADLLPVWETGARYHMYHALAILAVALAAGPAPARAWAWAGWLFAAGIVVFSGSLYLMTVTGMRWLGAITPIGGAAFLAGWVAAALGARGTLSS